MEIPVKVFSTSQAAQLMGVSVASVASWIDQGSIQAGRTPGGHRRITAADLLQFLRQQRLPIPPQLLSSKPRVLVVDDEEAIANLLVDEITTAHPDYEVRQAHDGFAAGEVVGSWTPNAVILDLRMPGMDGYEVCRRIKSRQETEKTEVIAITAYYSAETERKMLECGARVCLAKPLDMDILLAELDAAMQACDSGQMSVPQLRMSGSSLRSSPSAPPS